MEPLTLLLLILIRIACLMLTAPVLGTRQVPLKMRLVLIGFVTLAIFPLISSQQTVDANLLRNPERVLSMAAGEMAIGAMLGLSVTILVTAAKTAGTIIGQLAGMQWTTDTDPESGEPVSAVSQLFGILSLAIFVLMGGPEMVLGAVMDSFVNIPVGTQLSSLTGLAMLGDVMQQSLVLTLRGVGPAVAALLISTITIGMIGRVYPHLANLGLGFNSNQFVFMFAILLTMGGCVWLFTNDIEGLISVIEQRMGETG